MPSFLHAFKLAHDRGIAARKLTVLIAAVISVTVLVSWVTTIKLGYDHGALQFGQKFFTGTGPMKSVKFVEGLTTQVASPQSNWFWLSFGGVLTYAMMLARSRFLFFPFHPLGYLVCLVFPAEQFWTSIFLGWGAKSLITRYGGVDTVRQVTPMFIGLILGDVLMMLFWLIIDSLTGRTGHLLMPG